MRRTELFVIAILLAACSTPATPLSTPTPAASPTITPTYTPWPTSTATYTKTLTFTPQPTATLVIGETPLPTFTPDPISCGDLDAAWGTAAWPVALQVLDRLQAAGRTCGDTTLASKRYAVHINYAIT